MCVCERGPIQTIQAHTFMHSHTNNRKMPKFLLRSLQARKKKTANPRSLRINNKPAERREKKQKNNKF